MHISPTTDWHNHLLESTDEIRALLRATGHEIALATADKNTGGVVKTNEGMLRLELSEARA